MESRYLIDYSKLEDSDSQYYKMHDSTIFNRTAVLLVMGITLLSYYCFNTSITRAIVSSYIDLYFYQNISF